MSFSRLVPCWSFVSNLLGSPASGEEHPDGGEEEVWVNEFPIYWVPQRVGSTTGKLQTLLEGWRVSNLLGSPASGERTGFR